MALGTNSFGGVDLLATATDLDKRVTALEGGGTATAPSDNALATRVEALEAELTALRNALEPTGLPVKE
jgi:hypothetical protein